MAKKGIKIIDAEMHVMEPGDLWELGMGPEFKSRAPRRLSDRPWDIRTLVEGEVLATIKGGTWAAQSDVEANDLARRFEPGTSQNFDPDSQLKAMDREGLDIAVLFPTSGMYAVAVDGMDPRLAAAVSRSYNDWLANFCKASPSRLFGAALISPHDVDLAAIEARRAVQELGMKALFIRPNLHNGRAWHSSYYDPLWATAEELDVPVCFHETTGSRMPAAGAERFSDMGIAHISTHPIEMMMACMDIIMGGVTERFPKLRFAFLEAQCGWLPFWLGRMDEHYEWRKSYGEMAYLKAQPSEYFRRQCYCAMECDEEFASHVVDAFGDDNLVTTSDYPHSDSKYPNAIDTFLDLPLSDESKKKVLWNNPVRLYSL